MNWLELLGWCGIVFIAAYLSALSAYLLVLQAAGLDDAPDSKIIACYMSMGELRAIKATLAALKDRTDG